MKRYLLLLSVVLLLVAAVPIGLAGDAFSLYEQALSSGRPLWVDVTVSPIMDGSASQKDASLLLSFWQKDTEEEKVQGLDARLGGETLIAYEERLADGLLYLSGETYGDKTMVFTAEEFADYYAKRAIPQIREALQDSTPEGYLAYIDDVGLSAYRQMLLSYVNRTQPLWEAYRQFAIDFLGIDTHQTAEKINAAIVDLLKGIQTESICVYSPYHDAAVSRSKVTMTHDKMMRFAISLLDVVLDSKAIRMAAGMPNGMEGSMRAIMLSAIQTELENAIEDVGDLMVTALFDNAGALVSLSLDRGGVHLAGLDIRTVSDGKRIYIHMNDVYGQGVVLANCLLAQSAFHMKAQVDGDEISLLYQKEEKHPSPQITQTMHTASVQVYEDSILTASMLLSGDLLTTALRGDDFSVQGTLTLSTLIDSELKALLDIGIHARTQTDIKPLEMDGAVFFSQISKPQKDAWANAVTSRTWRMFERLFNIAVSDIMVEYPEDKQPEEKSDIALQIAFEPGTLFGADEKAQQAYQDLLNALTLTIQSSQGGMQTQIKAMLEGETAFDYQSNIGEGDLYLSTSLLGGDVIGIRPREFVSKAADLLQSRAHVNFDAASITLLEGVAAHVLSQNNLDTETENPALDLMEALTAGIVYESGTFSVPGQADAVSKSTQTVDAKALLAAVDQVRNSRKWTGESLAWLDNVKTQIANVSQGAALHITRWYGKSGQIAHSMIVFLSQNKPTFRLEWMLGQEAMLVGYVMNNEAETEVLRLESKGKDWFFRVEGEGAVTLSYIAKPSLLYAFEVNGQVLDKAGVPVFTLFGEGVANGQKASLKLFLGEKETDRYAGTLYFTTLPAVPIKPLSTKSAIFPVSLSPDEQGVWSEAMLQKYDSALTELLLRVPRSVFSLALDYMK